MQQLPHHLSFSPLWHRLRRPRLARCWICSGRTHLSTRQARRARPAAWVGRGRGGGAKGVGAGSGPESAA